MSGIFRYIKCLLYDFPYPILPEEMIKQKAPEDVITCNSGSKYCCMFECRVTLFTLFITER